ncbi:LCP family protein [Streptomyces sp. NPDC059850]|uniref:LCP family protein n=1 Tax=Streptomyces sp. NPDC059850 TaxID=3346970 RepID=UPI003653BB3B
MSDRRDGRADANGHGGGMPPSHNTPDEQPQRGTAAYLQQQPTRETRGPGEPGQGAWARETANAPTESFPVVPPSPAPPPPPPPTPGAPGPGLGATQQVPGLAPQGRGAAPPGPGATQQVPGLAAPGPGATQQVPGITPPMPRAGQPGPGATQSIPGLTQPVRTEAGLWRPDTPAPRTPSAQRAPYEDDPEPPVLRRRAPREPLSRRRKVTRLAIVMVSALLVASGSAYIWVDTQMNREVDLNKAANRPPLGKGTNYLIVGSDSRAGLSAEAKQTLRTGSAEGGRTDSMMVLHTGANGTTMLSLPRDSWVRVPSYVRPETGKRYGEEQNKLNAAYSRGGPDLLVQTIERNTGLHINHYAEIGFGGFVDIVDAVGGVRMCVDRDIKDEKSGLDLKKGCQVLDGGKALSFVRQRKQEANGDLGRTQNQQKFLAALAEKAATPGVLANPFAAFPTVSAGLDTLIVDKQMNLQKLMSLFQAMKGATSGNGKRLNVPVSNTNLRTSKGSAVQWDDAQAKRLFEQLRGDQPVDVPASLPGQPAAAAQ